MSEAVTPSGLPAVRQVAVIDIGATAIRMVLAEITEEGHARTLESLRQGVQLGKDTFSTGRIRKETIRECIEVLRGFKKVMQEYGVNDPAAVNAVATSSVREAENGENFVDRIYIATGINVRIIEESEESRLTYMAIRDTIRGESKLADSDVVAVEIGGGSTELLLIRKGHVAYANSYRMGSLRMRETLQVSRTPKDRIKGILGEHIDHAIDQMLRDLPEVTQPVLIAMAGDARLAAGMLCPDWVNLSLGQLEPKALAALTDKLLPMPVEKLVQKYKLTYPEAETIGPALLTYVRLAKAIRADEIYVPKTNMREGLLKELCLQCAWTETFEVEVIQSALAMGEKFSFDRRHAEHVAELCMQMFRQMQPEHQLGRRHELILRIAALLHDVGEYVSNRSHHKHSMYLILNSALFGLNRRDITMIALVARYHRRAMPDLTHEEYGGMDRDSRIAIAKLAAILRVVDGLDRNHMQHARTITYQRTPDELVLTVADVEDLTVERLAVREKADLFEDVYGMQVVLKEERTAARGGASE